MIANIIRPGGYAIDALRLLTFVAAVSVPAGHVFADSNAGATITAQPIRVAANSTGVADEAVDAVSDSYAAEFTRQIAFDPDYADQALVDDSQISCVIEPNDIIEVASPVTGIIDRIEVERGSYVKAGQTIATLKMDLERVNVDLFEARLEFRERAHIRMEEVFKKNYVSSDEFDQAKIERDIAKFELDREAELLKMKTVTSPISGFVTEKYLSSGEYVESEPIVKVVKIHPLHVEVTALIDMLDKVKKGDRAQVYLEGPVKGPLTAVVDIVDKVIDPASGTFGIRLKLPNPKHRIPSGVKCRVDWKK